MRINKLYINGMHKAHDKMYEFNDNVTYFVGPNGAGKSTILEAIQLALLGYIPGYPKKNDSIYKHASSKYMNVRVTLDDESTIDRDWTKRGSSVSSSTALTGNLTTGDDVKALFGEIELPIFNFNEFRGMTSNKLKEWFISFLPDSDTQFNLEAELREALKDTRLPYDEIIARTMQWANDNPANGVDLIKGINAFLKEDQSFTKGQISKLAGTIQSLIYYDDLEDVNADEIQQKIEFLEKQKEEIIASEAQHRVILRLQDSISSLKDGLPADKFSDDPRVDELKQKIQMSIAKSNAGEQKITDIKNEISKLTAELDSIKSEYVSIPSAESVCPYTKEKCDVASGLSDKYEEQRSEILARINAKQEEISAKQTELSNLDTSSITKFKMDAQIAQGELNEIENQYIRLQSLEAQLANDYSEEIDLPDTSLEEVVSELDALRDRLVKVKANEQYNQLKDKITKDKFQQENELEILKLLIKCTDANGLQAKIMNGPFLNLADNMSTYLSKMFGEDTQAKFNLESKSNSFSFGLIRDGNYVEFDYLSSGEQCLFTLALMLCILDASNSKLKVILIDDILDHLDEENADHLFSALKQIEGTQFILAGVKECKDTSICQAV